jgi:hypothetical protein
MRRLTVNVTDAPDQLLIVNLPEWHRRLSQRICINAPEAKSSERT